MIKQFNGIRSSQVNKHNTGKPHRGKRENCVPSQVESKAEEGICKRLKFELLLQPTRRVINTNKSA